MKLTNVSSSCGQATGSRSKQPSIPSPKGRAPAHPPAKARQALAYRSALALVAWSVALLISDQAQASGVCIICPPGFDCPTGGAPVIQSGSPGQFLRRSATGTEWANISAIQGPMGPQGPQGVAGAQGAPGVAPALPPCVIGRLSRTGLSRWGCTANSSSPPPAYSNASTGGNYCWCRFEAFSDPSCNSTPWIFTHAGGGCSSNCPMTCGLASEWRMQNAWSRTD